MSPENGTAAGENAGQRVDRAHAGGSVSREYHARGVVSTFNVALRFELTLCYVLALGIPFTEP